jgi:sulfate permease, SulP family
VRTSGRWGTDVLAGVTLAMLAVPEVLGYARIAGMPVVTGLYTMLLPMVAFALLGSSRHLVVGADSATAAILAAGLVGLAVPGDPRYVRLAGTVAVLVAVLLLVARLVGLGFLANFLSRTVLVGFLTGVGIQVAVGQLADMIGVPAGHGSTPEQLWQVLGRLPQLQPATALVAAAVVGSVLAVRVLDHRIPGALIAVIGSIVAAHLIGLDRFGVALLGSVPAGLPGLAVPAFAPSDVLALLPVAVSMSVVILAQSAATARAYADRFDERVDTDRDLVALGAANLTAAATGTFVVNGSPTKTQMVVGAGGRSQRSQLTAVAVVVLVCLVATGLLSALPLAALAAVVFLIGIELVDVAGMRRIRAVRRAEFVVALLTTAAVVLLGVQQGIVVAIAVSIIDHLRHSYEPRSSVLVKSPAGHWRSLPVTAGARTAPGLLVYRFGSGLYFANASRLAADVAALTGGGPGERLRWFCLDAAAIGDVDYSAAVVLGRVCERLHDGGVRVIFSNVSDSVRAQLQRYGLAAAVGPDAFYDTSGEVLAEFGAPPGMGDQDG